MNLLNTFLYYVCFASAVLIYGLGTNKVVDLNNSKITNIIHCAKLLVSILLSALLSWFVTKGVLIPIRLGELFPLVSFLIFICINAFLEALIRLTTGKSTTEFVFSYLVILLAIGESTSLMNTIIICVSCLLSFLFTIPFIVAFMKRNRGVNSEKYYCRLFLYIAILIFVISVFDIVWFNPGVMQ